MMNERIKELVVEADLHGDSYGRVANAEKFAELIVQECCEAVYAKGETYAILSAGKAQSGWFADVIEKHFGVK
jgi:hypothetical protein